MRLESCPHELTEEESDAGFRLMRLEDRKSLLCAILRTEYVVTEVVAHQLSESDLVVRIEDSIDGLPQYARLRWGRQAVVGRVLVQFLDWHLCERVFFSDPGEAIQGFLFDREPQGVGHIIPEPFKTFP